MKLRDFAHVLRFLDRSGVKLRHVQYLMYSFAHVYGLLIIEVIIIDFNGFYDVSRSTDSSNLFLFHLEVVDKSS